MLSELIQLLSDKKNMIDEMSKEFTKMLAISKEMFVSTTDLIFLDGDKHAVRKEIYPKDKKINKLEQNIRRQVVMHLSVSGVSDLASMLIFLAIARDAERIGDNTKNIYDLYQYHPDINSPTGKKTIKIRNEIVSFFSEIIEIFASGKKKQTNQCLTNLGRLMKECDLEISTLLKKRHSNQDAAIFVLLLRYFKRILAHMSNIATSLVMPIDKLDYFDKSHKTKLK